MVGFIECTPIINSTISTMMMVYNIGNLLSNIVEKGCLFSDSPNYVEIIVGLNDSQQVQNNEYDGNNEQCVDPTARAGKLGHIHPAEIAE